MSFAHHKNTFVFLKSSYANHVSVFTLKNGVEGLPNGAILQQPQQTEPLYHDQSFQFKRR